MNWADYCTFRPAFGDVIDSRYYTLPWLDDQILSGKLRFWSNGKAALVVEIREYPTGAKDGHVMIAAGDKDTIIDELRPQAEAWAKSQGCLAALVESREGWSRALKDAGYVTFQTTVKKEL